MSDDDFTTSILYRDIPSFPGYRVGEDGSIWSCKRKGSDGRTYLSSRWRQMQATHNRQGYRCIKLTEGGKKYFIKVSRLVLLSFIGPCPLGHEACHLNDVKTDDRLCNLKWDTRLNNVKQKIERGRQARGESQGLSKLTEDDVRAIRVLSREGASQREIAKLFGVTRSPIQWILSGKTWKHVK